VGRRGQSNAKNTGDLPGTSEFSGSVINQLTKAVLSVGNFDPDSAGFTTGLVSKLFLDSSNCKIKNFEMPNQAIWTSTVAGNFNFLDDLSASIMYDASGSGPVYTDSSLCIQTTASKKLDKDLMTNSPFPNPATNILFLRGQEIQNAEWIDVFGRTFPANSSYNESENQILTDRLPKGQYLLRYQVKGKTQTRKVGILRD
jgi:hypothetical protein